MGLNVNSGRIPDLEISTLEFSSEPSGISLWGILGMDDKSLSSSPLILDCNLLIFSISIVILLDLSKRALSFDFEIVFFSFSKVSFSWIYLRWFSSNFKILFTSRSIYLFFKAYLKLSMLFLISLILCIFIILFFNNIYRKYR